MTRTEFGRLLPLVAATAAVAVSAWLLGRRKDPQHPPDSAPGRTARRARFGRYIVTGRTVTIAASPKEIYDRFCAFDQLAAFMENVRSVAPGPEPGTWAWEIGVPGGDAARVITRLVTDRPGEAIAWRSVGGSDIDTEGKVLFRLAPGGRGTEVSAIVAYRPPGGRIGHWVAKAFGRDPRSQGRHELKRLKMLVETGEIATAAMRPHRQEA